MPPPPPICADCSMNPGTFDIRRRHLCQDCFIRYVGSKILKRMTTYHTPRFNSTSLSNGSSTDPTQPPPRLKLLLPLSGGPASLALLHVLDAHLKRQLAKHNRTAYDLVLVHIRGLTLPLSPSATDATTDTGPTTMKWREHIRHCFPAHDFSGVFAPNDVFAFDDRLEPDLRSGLNLTRGAGESDFSLVKRLFSSVRTPTARRDLEECVLVRLIVGVAIREGCEGVLWGHSDSRLAAKTLADVAKGRGGGVPDRMGDGVAVVRGGNGTGIGFTHPVRDLLTSELHLYLKCVGVEGSGCLLPGATDGGVSEGTTTASVRNMAIDDLLTGYIESQGEKYPSIMANVVKTASKLQVPNVGVDARCRLCLVGVKVGEGGDLCYGCARMKQDIMA